MNGLGRACDSNRDCAANLACHVDHEHHVVDGQCAAFCASNADCVRLGARAKCIGAGICVASCAADVDCPAHTRCADEGFCERTGPDSGRLSCSGKATPCGVIALAQCSSQEGCSDGMGCVTDSGYCSMLADQESCMAEQACTWYYATATCAGAPSSSPCSSFLTDVGCHQQRGCIWAPSCTGKVAEPDCSKISSTLCELVVGCRLDPG